jgi:signal transduction histidine kinase
LKRRVWVCCQTMRERLGATLALRVLLVWLCFLPSVQAELLELRAARVSTNVDGVVEQRETTLPYYWDRQHQNRPGAATFEVPFTVHDKPTEPYGVYFPRVGNTAEIWLNGILLSRLGDTQTANMADYAKAPQYVLIPAQLLQTDNLFRITLHADGGRRGGLSAVTVGPEQEVRDIFTQAYHWRVTSSMAVVMFSLVVSVMAMVLWMTQSDSGLARGFKRDGVYLSAGVAELCWVVRLSDVALVQPPLTWPWWSVVQSVAYAGWMCCAALFCHHVAGWHRHVSMHWVRLVLWWLMLSSAPVAYWAQTQYQQLYLTLWLGSSSFLFIGYGLFYFGAALRRPTKERMLVATAGLLNVVVGFRDWLVIRVSDGFDVLSWIRFSSVLFGLALGYIVIARFREASAQARDLMANMAAKVVEKERALAVSYQQLEQLAREQERTAERSRILRDMHDGVGSHISAAIRQLQSGKASNEQMLQTLRESLDQLKLSIDAMNLPPGDITALLANLRYRLEPRFKASDIELQWDVDLLPPLARLDDKAMRQLQFMVFEALSNVLQHARASELRIELRGTPGDGAQLRVIDNGCGFDPRQVQPKGLGSLRERAATMGARLEVSSVPGRTVVEIVLG